MKLKKIIKNKNILKNKKIMAVILAVCMFAVSVTLTSFANISVNEESTESLKDSTSQIETEDLTTEEASPYEMEDPEIVASDENTENTEKTDNTENNENIVTEADALPDTIVLTAKTSDGVMVTVKAETTVFASAQFASPSDAEEDVASPSNAIPSDEFDPELLTLIAEVAEEENEESVNKALEDLTKDDNIASRKTYDICILYAGEKIKPAEEKKLEISFTLPDVPSGADRVSIYHHTEDGIETVVDEKLDEVKDNQEAYEADENSTENADATEEITNIDETDESLDGDVNNDVIEDVKDKESADAVMITVTGETRGFSLYTIDFIYSKATDDTLTTQTYKVKKLSSIPKFLKK